MKPFDGGGWRGVSRIGDAADLMRSYDASGQSMMHLQQGLESFDVFVRALAIGPQVNLFNYDPSQPMHNRYQIDRDFLSPEKAQEATAIVKTINAFFRWEFNSCESISEGRTASAHRLCQRLPGHCDHQLALLLPVGDQVAVSLEPLSLATDRQMRLSMNTHDYFAIADFGHELRRKAGRLRGAGRCVLRDRTLQRISRQRNWHTWTKPCGNRPKRRSSTPCSFSSVRSTFPPHEHDAFIAHFPGLIELWVNEEAG